MKRPVFVYIIDNAVDGVVRLHVTDTIGDRQSFNATDSRAMRDFLQALGVKSRIKYITGPDTGERP